jgi:uncharacterized protein (TIGR03546 family)
MEGGGIYASPTGRATLHILVMLFLKLLQSMIKALNSQGTPGQVAAGMALGAALGLTPLASLHNFVILLLALVLNVSLPGFMLGWTLFVPIGFLLDPLFDAIGNALLGAPGLAPLWTKLANTPVITFTNFNNSVVLGSLVVWVIAWLPIFFAARWAVTKYRAHIFERLQKTKFFQAVRASALYQVYLWFQP